MADEQAKEKLFKVKVRVPTREAQGFKGFYSAQRFWPNGDSEAVVPESVKKQLEAEDAFLAVISAEEVSGQTESAPEAVVQPKPPAQPSGQTESAPEAVVQPKPPAQPTEEKPGPGKKLIR